MLKDLLNELDIKIQISREKLELASIEKKKTIRFASITFPRNYFTTVRYRGKKVGSG